MTQEQALISALQSDEACEKAFKQLVDEYKERLYWQIRNMVLDHNDADDVLQNTLIKIYKNIKSGKGDSKLHTWMYRTAANASSTVLNKKAQQNRASVDEIKSGGLEKL